MILTRLGSSRGRINSWMNNEFETTSVLQVRLIEGCSQCLVIQNTDVHLLLLQLLSVVYIRMLTHLDVRGEPGRQQSLVWRFSLAFCSRLLPCSDKIDTSNTAAPPTRESKVAETKTLQTNIHKIISETSRNHLVKMIHTWFLQLIRLTLVSPDACAIALALEVSKETSMPTWGHHPTAVWLKNIAMIIPKPGV